MITVVKGQGGGGQQWWINKFLNVNIINLAEVDKGGKTLIHQKWIICLFLTLTLVLNAKACLNNRTFQTVEQEKLTRKFNKNNSWGILEAGKYIFSNIIKANHKKKNIFTFLVFTF